LHGVIFLFVRKSVRILIFKVLKINYKRKIRKSIVRKANRASLEEESSVPKIGRSKKKSNLSAQERKKRKKNKRRNQNKNF